MARFVVHVDFDAFFASVEMRLRPELANRPIAIAHDGPRSVVSTASYPARAFGVRSAIPLSQARNLCPGLVVVEPRFDAYMAVSDHAFGILARRSVTVERVGIDEGYLIPDLGEREDIDALLSWSDDLRAEIRETLGLPLSFGAGSTKLIAKLASDAAKPDGKICLDLHEEDTFLIRQPLRALPGIGPVTSKLLQENGIDAVSGLRERPRGQLVRLLGYSGGTLWDFAHNIDPRVVHETTDSTQIGVEHTFEKDLTGSEISTALSSLSIEICRRLNDRAVGCRSLTLKIRRPDMTAVTRSFTFGAITNSEDEIRRVAFLLLDKVLPLPAVRLLGLTAASLATSIQLPLFEADTGPSNPSKPATPRGLSDGDDKDAASKPRAPITTRLYWGMPVDHTVYGSGTVVGLQGETLAIRFEEAVRLFDLTEITTRKLLIERRDRVPSSNHQTDRDPDHPHDSKTRRRTEPLV